MVDLARDAVGHDAAGVRLPRGGIDANRDGAVGRHPRGHLILVLGQVLVAVDVGASRLGKSTRGDVAATRHVRVARLGGDVAALC